MALKQINILMDEAEHRRIKAFAALRGAKLGEYISRCVKTAERTGTLDEHGLRKNLKLTISR
jgi:hypothetical protein